MVGSGSVVTMNVPDFGLVWGNPARLHGFVCPCGERLEQKNQSKSIVTTICPTCKREVEITLELWEQSRL